MGRIKQLTENTVNKIAAGEVVERPLSIVKELVENSLDAGGKNISVQIEKGGKKSIRVKDDGCGLVTEDLFMALERHATSKITSIEELTSISTMGFRGEAIPSISSVTKFSIASAVEHGDGYKIVMENGRIVNDGPQSMQKGTEVNADNIFFNIPARKKFLKSDEREYALIREIIQKFAVVHYETAFSLDHNGKNSFHYPALSDRLSRILHVWKASEKEVSSLTVETTGSKVTAFVPSPFASFPGISVVFVNDRIVSDRLINSVIYRTFREVIGGEFKSPVVLEIKLDPAEVDINVHPSKMEVRFHDQKKIITLIKDAITGAFHSFREEGIKPSTPDFISEKKPEYKVDTDGLIHGGLTSFKKENLEKREVVIDTIVPFEIEQSSFYDLKIKDYKILGTVFGVYIVVESEDRLIFLDQHASHERITFCRLKKNCENKSGLSQLMIIPSIIKMSPKELSILEEASELLSNAGFVVEKFDEESAILRAVPALGFDANWENVVKELAGELENYGETFVLNEKLLSMLAVTACRSSVKSNDLLSRKEIEQLINDVNESNTLTCPHGRPFFHIIKKSDLEKQVKRK